MDVIIMVFVGAMCGITAIKIFQSEERNKIFNQRPIEVVAPALQAHHWPHRPLHHLEITICLSGIFGGIVTILGTIAIVLEAFAVMKIYNKIEIKMLKKR